MRDVKNNPVSLGAHRGEGNHMNGQEDSPPEYGMELFGGKWNSRIICVFYKDEGVTPIVRCRKCDHKG